MSEVVLSHEVASVVDEVVTLRRDLHQHPELAFEEYRTAALVAERLRSLGLEPRTGIAGTGVTALVGNGQGPTLLLRADMDALPVQEENEVPYRSTVPGKMHACGHDGHTAMLLGLAKLLAERRETLPGRVKLCFQPAEERGGGARPMIEAGVLADPPVDAAFAMHLWASLPTGTIATAPGPLLAASDAITIQIRGKGGHAASPAECVDPVLVGAQLVTALQSVVSRNVEAHQAAVVSITQFHAGDADNVIPDSATLNGTVRTFDGAVRSRIERRLQTLVEQTAAAFGATAELDYQHGYPAVVNEPTMTNLVSRAAAEVVGEEAVLPLGPVMGAEDFAYFLREVPGCFFVVGINNEAKGTGQPHHNPRFDLDEDALGIGVEVMLRVVERALEALARR
ncbi:MAG: amidohydrolase [Armatimonadetes bacterium]|nr:amidohydrolase [Armatimonadota bacterium]